MCISLVVVLASQQQQRSLWWLVEAYILRLILANRPHDRPRLFFLQRSCPGSTAAYLNSYCALTRTWYNEAIDGSVVYCWRRFFCFFVVFHSIDQPPGTPLYCSWTWTFVAILSGCCLLYKPTSHWKSRCQSCWCCKLRPFLLENISLGPYYSLHPVPRSL